MKGDFTRNTFHREKHYSSVRWQQGRVGPLDSEWNEQIEIDAHRRRTTRRDVIGYCGGPAGLDEDGEPLAGFALTPDGDDVRISRGRYYVAGILCENEGESLLGTQPDLPGFDLAQFHTEAGPGLYLIYLDVWERHITALDDAEIREVALGGPDTTTRTRVICQVRAERLGDEEADAGCSDFGPGWAPEAGASSGRLAARAEPDPESEGPCIVPPGAGFRRLENQLYRVEIHEGGAAGSATFKWSRENGSVVSRWEAQDGNNLTVSSAGRDRLLGFRGGDWIELTDDGRELQGRPGILVQLSRVDGDVLIIDPATINDPDDGGATTVDRDQFPFNPRVRRWDSVGAQTVELPVDGDDWTALEEGVQVQFSAGEYRTGDYWTIPARTVLGDVLWPQNGAGPASRRREGVRHYYCPLGIGVFDGETWGELSDCRRLFPPLTEISREDGCCEVTVGDGVRSIGDFNELQDAVEFLEDQSGVICLLPGDHRLRATVEAGFEQITIQGCGPSAQINAPGNQPALRLSGRRGLTLSDLAVNAASDEGAVIIESSSDVRLERVLIVNRNRVQERPPERPPREETPVEEPPRDDVVPGRPERPREEVEIGQPASDLSFAGLSPARRLNAEAVLLSRTPSLLTGQPALVALQPVETLRLVRILTAAGPALIVRESAGVEVRSSTFYGLPAVELQARDVELHGNRLSGGGLWVWDGSSRIQIEENQIVRGVGPGIILGGLSPNREPSRQATGVVDVEVSGNTIREMSGSGISSIMEVEERLELGELESISIAHNRIESCAGGGIDERFDDLAVGGIVLRSVTNLRIHDNLVRENRDESGGPVCGIFLHGTLGLEIADNEIIDNGSAETGESMSCLDFRTREEDEGPNPRDEEGMRFTVFDFRGEMEEITRIARFGAFTGLNVSRRTVIDLPTPVSDASVTLVNFATPGRVAALDAAGNVVDEASMERDQGVEETLRLAGSGIVQFVVEAPQNEMLLLEICVGAAQPGFQGGIIGWYLVGGRYEGVAGTSMAGSGRGMAAALIRDNVVSAPRGQALILVGAGPVSVAGNLFASGALHDQPRLQPENDEQQIDLFSQIGKCVSIYNAGRSPVLADATPNFAVGSTTRLASARLRARAEPALPSGPILFHGNQCRLELGESDERGLSMVGVAAISLDDIGVSDNQLLTVTPRATLLATLAVVAPSVRVSLNRISELPQRARFSCLSSGSQFNVTTENQSTHCVIAQGGSVVDRDNQVLLSESCQRFNDLRRARSGFTVRR